MRPPSGKGPSLRETSPYLRDEAECIARIIDVAERNSMIEGLPPFDDALRDLVRRDLQELADTAYEQKSGTLRKSIEKTIKRQKERLSQFVHHRPR